MTASGHLNGAGAMDDYTDKVDRTTSGRLYHTNTPSSISMLKILCSRTIDKSFYPHCKSTPNNIPVYDLSSCSSADEATVSALQEEWHSILHTGPGVYVLKHFYAAPYLPVIDQSNEVFDRIIAAEAANSRGDHFAASNANSRIWNSLQKHAIAEPRSFVQYYANPWLRHASESWLGPDYTVTAQVNIVRPGGAPQMPHRDYHLGFQTAEQCAHWPKTMHAASQFLTLQGAVAHSDMPLESGPTRFLPFSQLLEDGYMAWRRDDVKEYFADKWVSLPLEKGDAVFFNPALIHAAGENRTEPGPDGIDRSANLLQISSAFGKTMEKIDHEQIVIGCWDELRAQTEAGKLNELETECAVRAMADGYPFPTNLDKRPPAPGGMAPESQLDIVLRALKGHLTKTEVVQLLRQFREESSA
ncbi:hypothetical protein LTR70_009022 [Exophiala xenobiotica]|uniref:Phytanoyl-CoA dioxygenase n=1 Tax=Lithohypha guttulata TaxID=1690604 RepID=A0ABR0JZ36_9EURO|nr:hypothetical protein LTR24_008719 [Lithohypha guttulata]KAK5311072.1 hypothetical protein LTR70_009022 [Exophiala xenobiotica]